jgi:hypothetical protein
LTSSLGMFSITWNRQDPGGELPPFVQNSGFGGGQPPGSWRNGRYLAGWGEEHPSTCNIEHERYETGGGKMEYFISGVD